MHISYQPNIRHKIALFCLLLGISLFAHTQTHSDSIKTLIQKLQSENNIIAANRLLNQNTTLGIDYTFRVLHENLKLAEDADMYEAVAYTRLSIGNFWFMRGNKIKAYENYRICETISRKHGFAKIIGLSLMNASNLINYMEKRIHELKMAIPYFIHSADSVNLAKAYLNIGNCYSTYILGPEILWTSTPLDSTWNQTENIDTAFNYRDSAFYYYDLAKLLNINLKHHELSASYNLRMAQWLSYDKNFSQAEVYFQTSILYFNQARLYKGTVYCLIELLDSKMKQNKITEAHTLADSALMLASQYGFTDYYSDVSLLKSKLYETSNDYNNALLFFKQYYTSAVQYNANLIEEKIDALNLELTVKEHENTINSLLQQSRMNRLIILTVIIIALSVLVAAYLYLQNRKRKIKYIQESMKKAEELNSVQIKLLNTELENNNLNAKILEEKINSRSETLIMVANKVQKLKNYYETLHEEINNLVQNLPPDKRSSELKPIKISMMQIAQEQNDLLELDTMSKQINQEFFFYMEQNYTNLTKEDKNLLSMLIADLNTKQIAGFLNITPDSVFKKRYRLRKKLNITNEISFTDFYTEILKNLGNP